MAAGSQDLSKVHSSGDASPPSPPRSYVFERAAANQPPRQDNADDYTALCERLELTADQAASIEKKLAGFITHHHANIAWYQVAIKRELRLRRIYFAISMGLLAVVPIVIFGVTTKGVLGADPNMTAAVTAGLSGLFAFHRGATAWLDKRQLVALYAKTSAQLKAAVYTFEQTWKTSRRGAKTLAELGMALEDATTAALAIVSAEQAAHYEIEAAPTFGLSDMIGSASSVASQLTSALAAKESQEDKGRRELERSIRELDVRAGQLGEMIAQSRKRLDGLADDERSVEVGQLSSLVAKRQSTELERAIAVAKLKSLRPT